MKPNTLTVARTLAPEDIEAGMYVSVLHEHESIMPFYHADNLLDLQNIEPFNWRKTPKKSRPLRVVSVCVPFVLAERPSGKHETLDVRRTSLAGLSEDFGLESFNCLKPKKKARGAKGEKDEDSSAHRRSWKRLWRRDRDTE